MFALTSRPHCVRPRQNFIALLCNFYFICFISISFITSITKENDNFWDRSVWPKLKFFIDFKFYTILLNMNFLQCPILLFNNF